MSKSNYDRFVIFKGETRNKSNQTIINRLKVQKNAIILIELLSAINHYFFSYTIVDNVYRLISMLLT